MLFLGGFECGGIGGAEEGHGGLDQLSPRHHRVGGFGQDVKGVVFNEFPVLPRAGIKQEGYVGDIVGNGIDAGVNQGHLTIRLRHPAALKLGQQGGGSKRGGWLRD